MWRVRNESTGKEQVWYEGELIERIVRECQEAIDIYEKEQFYEDDCDIFEGEAIMANTIMQLIQENEK